MFVSPIIPGLTDADVPTILKRASDAGAQWAAHTALRLPGSVEEVFISRLRATMPMRAERIIGKLREIRGGHLNDGRFGNRMRGSGPYWDGVRNLFRMCLRKYGLNKVAPYKHWRARNPKGTKPQDRQITQDQQMAFDF